MPKKPANSNVKYAVGHTHRNRANKEELASGSLHLIILKGGQWDQNCISGIDCSEEKGLTGGTIWRQEEFRKACEYSRKKMMGM